jgi:type IV fimbrial biogenesis protein FimT
MRAMGFTLYELLCAVLVAAVLLGIGVPSFGSFALDSARTADVNAFMASVQLARNEAAKRARSVVLCKTADWRRCGGAEIEYEAGWMIFVNEDGQRPPQRSEQELLLAAYQPRIAGTITSNRPLFDFRPVLQRSTNATVTFCDRRGQREARAVIVSYTGRPRVDTVEPDGSPLRCARLP